jgi:protein gp37
VSLNKTKIEWCDYSWNPVTGCRRGCSYCYARRIHNRFNKKPFTNIVFHEDRMADPVKENKPSTIFCGSMSGHEYWPIEWLRLVLQQCAVASWHTFVFLSKDVYTYNYDRWKDVPDNVVMGVTFEKVTEEQEEEIDYIDTFDHRTWINIEPLMGRIDLFLPSVELVIVGAMTGSGARKPLKEEIYSIKEHVQDGQKIFWKINIRDMV